MIKRFLIAFVLLALVCGGLVYFNIFRAQAIQNYFATMQQPAVPVSTVTVEPMEWQPGIEAIGTVNAARGIELALEAGGVVQEVNFTSNDRVEAGELLLQLADAIEQADLVAARSSVNLNEQTLTRAQTLRTRGVSAESSVEEAEAAAQSARSQVARLEAVLAQKALEAPFSGTIGIPQIEEGQYATTGTVVATLQDLDTMRVDFTVPEQSRNELEIGQPIRLGSEQGDLKYSGSIIGIEPRIDPNTRLITVRAEVDNADGGLSPGQFVRVRVELPAESDVLALPQTSVVTSLYGDYVYVVAPAENEQQANAAPAGETATDADGTEAPAAEDALSETGDGEAAPASEAAPETAAPALKLSQVFVQTGRRNGNYVEITEGVEAGTVVVSSGQNRLSNGMPVTIDPNPSPLERGEGEAEQVSR